ncbi:Ig-like domain-containing protein [Roseibium sediminicola]|uniref:Ig-like domain-containing protein n=1 Tax=Roseibium sediminicola TaxID=2933272 RepID=A0ABT0GNN1_9HYPH|nr:Ig-like domain-containing protein [Roseibium sp. CAU 1639]MCK7610946.1 Ig-like domain-containing protein [Roseibium sp. CAU 1639]
MSDSNNILTNGDFEATGADDATGAVDHGTWFTAEAIEGWQATEGLIEIQDASSGGRGTPVDETGILASGSVLELDSYDYQSRCWRADGREADSTVSQSFTLEEASSFALGFSYAANCSTRTSDFSVTITDEDGNVVFFQEFSAREGNLEVAWQRFEANLDLDAGTYSLSFSSAQYEDRDTVGALIDNVSLVDTAPQAENDSYTLDLGETEVLDVTAVMGTETESVTVLDEDFSGTRHLKRLDTVASSDLAAVDGKAFSNACADGVLLFEPVDMTGLEAGTLSFVIDSDPTCWASFEASGSRFGDYVRVEISIDGGEFILLDLFSVPESEEGLAGRLQTFVGSLTGQTFSSDGATLSYALPEGAGSVQLRFVTDFSQFGEIVTFDDVLIQGEQTVETGYESGLLANDTDGNGEALEIVSAEGVDLFGSIEQDVTVFEENFDDAKRNLEKLETVEDSDLHGVDGAARTTNRSGGELEFAEVDITGLDNEIFSFSLNADLLGCQRFESYGWARDFVEVQVRFDDGSYRTIDVFDVEWRGGQQVFVGRESGQEVAVSDGFVALSYDLAALAGDAETAQIRLIAEASSHGEIFEVDDVSLAGTFTQRTGDGIATITLDSGAIVTIKSDGSFSYNANGQFAYLAEGEETTDTFSYTVQDASGNTDTATVTINLVGTNEDPVIGLADVSGAVTEIADGAAGENTAQLSDSGTIAFSDVDLIDTHSVTVTPVSATDSLLGSVAARGTLSAVVSDAATGDGAGEITWTFEVADSAVDDLAEGEVITQVYTVTVDDGQGGSASKTVTISLTGTNDSPVITTATGANEGAVTEAGDTGVPGTPVATGTLTSSDVDTGATATWSGDAAGTYGSFSIDPATGVWTYTLDNADGDTDALAAGETVTETFTATVIDDLGATATQVVTVTITGTNDSPVITTATGANEGAVVEAGDTGVPGTPVATGTLTSSDVDTGATATWSGDAAGTYGSFSIDPATGVWAYTLDNADGDTDALVVGETVTETFTATVTDDFGATATQVVTVTVTGTNDAPVIDAAASDLSGTVVEDSAETLSDTGTISFSDVDTTDLQSASRALVSVTGDLGPITAAQALTFLSLSGLSTSAFAQDSSVDWTFSADNALFDHLGCDEELVFTYEIAVSDAEGADTVQVSVTVTGTNDLPRVSGNVDGGTTHEDASPVTVDLLANASDAEGDDLGVANVAVTSSDGRTVVVQSVDVSTGEISIDPSQFNDLAAGEQATLTIAYDVIEEDRAYDDTAAGEALDNAGTFFIADNDTGSIIRVKRSSAIVTHQQAINAAGVTDGSVVLVDDNSRGLGVSAGTVVDGVFAIGDASAIQSMTNFTGTVGLDPNNVPPTYAFYEGTLADSTLTIAIPRDGGDCGDATHTFVFTGFDQAAPGIQPAFDALAVNVSPEPVPATATLVIEGRNDGPVAVNDDNADDVLVEQGFGVAGDDTASGNVIANDSDEDLSDVLSVTRVNSGTGEPGSDMAVDATTVQIVLGRYGSLAIQADGSWDYTLDNLDPDTEALADGETAFEVFTYTVSDGNGGEDTATLTLEISGSGDNVAPVANDDSFTVAEDTPATLDLLGNDTDGNNVPVVTQTLSVVSINGQAATAGATIATDHGTITIGAGGAMTYVPDLNYNGADSFTYIASDGLEDSGEATVTLDVAAVNDTPIAVDDTFAGDEDTAITGNVLANDSDVDGDSLTVTTGTFATSDGGSVTIAENGDFTYTPAPDFSGAATFDYTVSDGNGGTASGSVTLNVDAVADAPVIEVPGGTGELQAEQRANTYTLSTQYFSEVTTLADGGHVVTWASSGQDGSGTGIYAQRYAADGSAAGSEFRVNTTTTSTQQYASTTDLGDGGFVVVWSSGEQDGSSYGVFGQRFDADGNPAGSEFQINTYTNSTQYLPNVATLADGGFVVNWNSSGQDGSSYGIFAQRYDVYGDPVGTEFKVNTVTSGYQFNDGHINKNIAGLADGGFVISWQDNNSRDGSGYAVFAQQYDADGNTVGAEFQVNTYTTNNQLYANVAALTDGGYVITWSSNGQDGSAYGVFGQRYDASGNAVGSEFQVNTTTGSTQYFGGVTGLASGGFVVIWDSRVADGSGYGVVAQEFDAAGNKVGGEVLINTTTANDQRYSSIDARPDGGYVVTWSDNSADGSGWGVFVRAAAGSGASGDEDTDIALDVSAALTDTDGSETLSDITISGVPDGAVLSAGTDNNDGTWTVTQAQLSGLTLRAAENWNGSFDLTVSVTSTETSNGDTATSTQTFTVTVNPVNDGPVANDDGGIAAQEDVPLTIAAEDLLANDTDADIATNGQSLSISSVSNAVNGSVSLDVNGDVVFTPDANFFGETSFDYTVSDGNGGSSTATATIDVAPVNDAPVIDLAASDLTEEVTAGFRLSGSFDATDFLAAFDTSRGTASVVTVNGLEALRVQVNSESQRNPHTFLEIVEAGVLQSDDKISLTVEGQVTRTGGDQDIFFGLTDGRGQVSYFSVNGASGRLYAGDLETDAQPGDSVQNGAITSNAVNLSGGQNNSFRLEIVLDGENDTISIFRSNGALVGTFDGYSAAGDPADQTNALDPSLGLKLFLASDNTTETNYFVGLDYEMEIIRSGTVAFDDIDVTDTHSAAVASVTVTGDNGLLNPSDAFDFLDLEAVDQSADTVDWNFDMSDPALANVLEGLGAGESLIFDYQIQITDAAGATDTESLRITLNGDDFFA